MVHFNSNCQPMTVVFFFCLTCVDGGSGCCGEVTTPPTAAFLFTPSVTNVTHGGVRSAQDSAISPRHNPRPHFKPIRFSISAKFRRHWHTHSAISRSPSKCHWQSLLSPRLSNHFPRGWSYVITVTYSYLLVHFNLVLRTQETGLYSLLYESP